MPVVKVIELVGNSKVSWEDAAKNAVAEAAKTVRGITGIDVVGQTAVVENGVITEYRANVKIAFVVRGDVS
ncbi:MAG: dodecin domain-containing protein [Chloroflexi bacterium]|jgi:flavin-binding protein dodecin|nr:dodecin domain-containing protein [Chloroflexota bacterium]